MKAAPDFQPPPFMSIEQHASRILLKLLNVEVTVGFPTCLPVIILVTILRWPKNIGLSKLGRNPIPFSFKFRDKVLSSPFLTLVQVENGGLILLSDIRPLTVNLSRIMDFEKQSGKLFKARFLRVVDNLNRLQVASGSTTDFFLSRVFLVPTHVATTLVETTPLALLKILDAPEASASEVGQLRHKQAES